MQLVMTVTTLCYLFTRLWCRSCRRDCDTTTGWNAYLQYIVTLRWLILSHDPSKYIHEFISVYTTQQKQIRAKFTQIGFLPSSSWTSPLQGNHGRERSATKRYAEDGTGEAFSAEDS
ncbi:hypothetical protein BDV59DRAFT_30130 [Aspergillus ambiguus]|uniref:uncharacterized protein n=1 Tax=Aspergillus ambiguus TaxID=176160 RepID=UPI003CCD8D7E